MPIDWEDRYIYDYAIIKPHWPHLLAESHIFSQNLTYSHVFSQNLKYSHWISHILTESHMFSLNLTCSQNLSHSYWISHILTESHIFSQNLMYSHRTSRILTESHILYNDTDHSVYRYTAPVRHVSSRSISRISPQQISFHRKCRKMASRPVHHGIARGCAGLVHSGNTAITKRIILFSMLFVF